MRWKKRKTSRGFCRCSCLSLPVQERPSEVDIDDPDDNECSPLHIAILKGKMPCKCSSKHLLQSWLHLNWGPTVQRCTVNLTICIWQNCSIYFCLCMLIPMSGTPLCRSCRCSGIVAIKGGRCWVALWRLTAFTHCCLHSCSRFPSSQISTDCSYPPCKRRQHIRQVSVL